MMCLGEMGTAFQEGCAPIVVVFIGVKQSRRQLAPAGVDFSDADFAKMAQGFGWTGIRVTKPEDLAQAFTQAAANNGPVLIDVVIGSVQLRRPDSGIARLKSALALKPDLGNPDFIAEGQRTTYGRMGPHEESIGPACRSCCRSFTASRIHRFVPADPASGHSVPGAGA